MKFTPREIGEGPEDASLLTAEAYAQAIVDFLWQLPVFSASVLKPLEAQRDFVLTHILADNSRESLHRALGSPTIIQFDNSSSVALPSIAAQVLEQNGSLSPAVDPEEVISKIITKLNEWKKHRFH